jgi:hypothetical protein
MTHIAIADATLDPISDLLPMSGRPGAAARSVLIVDDGDDMAGGLISMICDFLEVPVERVAAEDDLGSILRAFAPMAVIAELDGQHRDGCDVMKTVAAFDRDLPILLLTDGNPAYLGAVDAVQEAWGLTRVATISGLNEVGILVDFLCHAARESGLSRMLRI